MKSTFILAAADCRLQADIMMIRLRRAGISIDRVSAIFSRRYAPNSFFFWLHRPRFLGATALKDGFFAAGRLHRMFGRLKAIEKLPSILRRHGVAPSSAERLVQMLRWGRPMICVHARNQDEMAVAWHILKHANADEIVISGDHGSARAAYVAA